MDLVSYSRFDNILQQQQQQQQQHSLLSQASWGRLEMKPTRHKGHGSGTLIASLQALLSKATSSEIFQATSSDTKRVDVSIHSYFYIFLTFLLSIDS